MAHEKLRAKLEARSKAAIATLLKKPDYKGAFCVVPGDSPWVLISALKTEKQAISNLKAMRRLVPAEVLKTAEVMSGAVSVEGGKLVMSLGTVGNLKTKGKKPSELKKNLKKVQKLSILARAKVRSGGRTDDDTDNTSTSQSTELEGTVLTQSDLKALLKDLGVPTDDLTEIQQELPETQSQLKQQDQLFSDLDEQFSVVTFEEEDEIDEYLNEVFQRALREEDPDDTSSLEVSDDGTTFVRPPNLDDDGNGLVNPHLLDPELVTEDVEVDEDGVYAPIDPNDMEDDRYTPVSSDDLKEEPYTSVDIDDMVDEQLSETQIDDEKTDENYTITDPDDFTDDEPEVDPKTVDPRERYPDEVNLQYMDRELVDIDEPQVTLKQERYSDEVDRNYIDTVLIDPDDDDDEKSDEEVDDGYSPVPSDQLLSDEEVEQQDETSIEKLQNGLRTFSRFENRRLDPRYNRPELQDTTSYRTESQRDDNKKSRLFKNDFDGEEEAYPISSVKEHFTYGEIQNKHQLVDEQGREVTRITTSRFEEDSDEIRRSTVRSDDQGRLVNTDGEQIQTTGSRPKQGRGGIRIVEDSMLGKDRKMWVETQDGEFRVGSKDEMGLNLKALEEAQLRLWEATGQYTPRDQEEADQYGFPDKVGIGHHSSLSGGRDIRAGGEIVVDDTTGKVTHMSNSSGHYVPKPRETMESIGRLDEQGVVSRSKGSHVELHDVDGEYVSFDMLVVLAAGGNITQARAMQQELQRRGNDSSILVVDDFTEMHQTLEQLGQLIQTLEAQIESSRKDIQTLRSQSTVGLSKEKLSEHNSALKSAKSALDELNQSRQQLRERTDTLQKKFDSWLDKANLTNHQLEGIKRPFSLFNIKLRQAEIDYRMLLSSLVDRRNELKALRKQMKSEEAQKRKQQARQTLDEMLRSRQE